MQIHIYTHMYRYSITIIKGTKPWHTRSNNHNTLKEKKSKGKHQGPNQQPLTKSHPVNEIEKGQATLPKRLILGLTGFPK